MMESSQYGQAIDDRGDDNAGTKKRIVTIAVSAIILVAMVVAVVVGVSHVGSKSSDQDNDAGSGSSNIQNSIKAIRAICQPTDYKKACMDSLKSASQDTTDPKELVKIGFQVTISKIKEAAKNSTVLKKLEKDPMTSKALDNCKELMDYAIGDLRHSFEQLGELEISKIDELLTGLKIWISASETYLETCLDGFENSNSNAAKSMKKALNTSLELTSNALAIVTEISTVLSSLQIPIFSRRLLSDESTFSAPSRDGFPTWISPGERRLLQMPPSKLEPNVIVAQDGSGKYKTIGEALKEVPKKNAQTFVIYVKEGIYKEKVLVDRSMSNVMMYGDGPTKTKITGRDNRVDGIPTFKSATFAVVGDHFMAKDMGFENTAGPQKEQAVALRVQSDFSVFFNCQMDGYQDTLYAHTHRQFYRDCTISGTIDFIFGNAAVVFQNCTMLVRKPMENQQCIVTAQGRKEEREPTGIVFQECSIKADPSYIPVKDTIKSYLGRPWKEFSRTIIMYTEIDDLIQPEGWLPWLGNFGLNTCFYTEINNRGPGADMSRRVRWPGVKTVSPDQAVEYTPGKFLGGDTWIPTTGVPYSSGLTATV